jgi:hypothetical protein
MTGIERHWLDEDIAKVRTYLNADPDLVSDGCIEEIMARNPGMGAKGIACTIDRELGSRD